ncbi:hypothetical protein Arub01_06690 [Actinomadura rubrobrunea]|uniref:DUF1707 domain-containing protein n=1 Tax=Actinomadura rubrobrunea TaxID=115335 RepID=A0A9W6PQ21_9ACTN|nr:DUF1707 domain-containing protein [Actinomadura rubrobrunea]GLW62425.1 hypothetical protein Arub01_06690 [Actinomadura rubrobrunea]
MNVEQRPRPVHTPRSSMRASDRDRDERLVLLHTAYAEGRLTEAELDERIDQVLAARTYADLDRLTADLPDAGDGACPARPAADGPRSRVVPGPRTGLAGRWQMAYKSDVRRTGRWRLPERYTVVVYKGACVLDLRSVELASSVTVMRVAAYKSRVDIVVPPDVRLEIAGLGVSSEVHGAAAGIDAPVVHVQGIAYKGTILAKDQLGLA